MKFYKFISVILHPIVIPTIGVLLYFMLISNRFESNQKLAILGLIFVTTYLVPLLILIVFKKFKLIKSFKTESIKERKIPITIMIVLFYLLGNTFDHTPNLSDLGLLFYSTSIGLAAIYVLFIFNFKTSIHLLSLGVSIGFFLVLSTIYTKDFTVVIIIGLIVSGILASSRLYLKAHTPKEIYVGFFLGFIAPIIINFIL